jgi:hypothetical protein
VSVVGFPYNVVDVLVAQLDPYLSELDAIVRRPLRFTDPPRCMGIYPFDWAPQVESMEISAWEPTLGRYGVRIQNLVQHGDEDEGREMVTLDATIARTVLYRGTELGVALGGLSESVLGHGERFKRFGVRNQQFMNNELRGQFVFLATMDLWVETERF